MIITVATYYAKDDPHGDYLGIRIYKDREMLVQYGDFYHDSGREKAEGFIECYRRFVANNVAVDYIEVISTEEDIVSGDFWELEEA